MACNHVKPYSYKIQNVLCDSDKLFFDFSRSDIISFFEKVYRSLRKTQ